MAVKLCRFELAAEPGEAKSGIAYEGRVYETRGAEAVGIHEASDIRLLAPMSRPNTCRFFFPGSIDFAYFNPGVIFGPNSSLLKDDDSEWTVYSAVAAIIGGHGARVLTQDADELVLGLSLGLVFRSLQDGGAGFDLGTAIGPVLVTPDDFEDEVIPTTKGRQYTGDCVIQINGEERERFALQDSAHTLAEIVASATRTCPLLEADLVLIGLNRLTVRVGDDIRLAHPKMGVLSTRIVSP